VFLHKHFVPHKAGSELDDIVRNLGYVLRAKNGCGSFLEGFGISETGYRTPEEMITQLSQEIRDAVGRYEPRVEIVEIEEDYDERGTVRLSVSFRVRHSDELLRLAFDPRSHSLTRVVTHQE
jgi:predicted component of type VI protein secretion system